MPKSLCYVALVGSLQDGCVLFFQASRNVSLWQSFLLKAPLIKSDSPRTISFLIDSELTDTHLITGVISHHIHRFCPHSRRGWGGIIWCVHQKVRLLEAILELFTTHSQVRCFMYCLWLLCVKTAEWNSCDRDGWRAEPKIFTPWHFTEKFTEPYYSWADISSLVIYCAYLEWQMAN